MTEHVDGEVMVELLEPEELPGEVADGPELAVRATGLTKRYGTLVA